MIQESRHEEGFTVTLHADVMGVAVASLAAGKRRRA